MNVEIASSLSGYIETLYNLNQKLIKLCGTNVSVKYEFSHKEILDIIQDVPRLVPYSDVKGVLKLLNSNGLLEYRKEIPYLNEDYDKILNNNYEILDKIRKIRNKYEHKMHEIKRRSSISGKYSFFEFVFKVKDEMIKIGAKELVDLIKQLNVLFSKLIKDIKKNISDEEKTNHPYYKRITRFDFENFNQIYDSKLLWIIGNCMIDF